MGSKSRVHHPPRPLPGPGMLPPDSFVHSPDIHAPPGAFPFDMMAPEIMEHKLIVQHEEMERIVTENRRFASTHFDLRRDLAATQQELQRLHSHMRIAKAEEEQQARGLLDNIAKMEAELQASKAVKVEYQQAYAEAQGLFAEKQELDLRVKQLTENLQKCQGDDQQISALMSELEALKQEYQQCRATYDYEKKLYTNHYESLQVMEKNYISMVREVEKLRAELTNVPNLEKTCAPNPERGIGGTYGSSAGYKENDPSGHHPAGQNTYEDGYGVPRAHGPPGGNIVAPYGGSAPLPAPVWTGYDASKGPSGSDAPRNANYYPSWGTPNDTSLGRTYNVARGVGNEAPPGNAAGVQAPAVPGNSVLPFGSEQAPNPYGAPETTSFYRSGRGSEQAPNPYEAVQTTSSYGSGHASNAYGLAQTTPQPYGSGQTYGLGHTHGSGQTLPPAMGGAYETPRGGNVAYS